jgi:hypothetical protein
MGRTAAPAEGADTRVTWGMADMLLAVVLLPIGVPILIVDRLVALITWLVGFAPTATHFRAWLGKAGWWLRSRGTKRSAPHTQAGERHPWYLAVPQGWHPDKEEAKRW